MDITIRKNEKHPSIQMIKQNFRISKKFSLEPVSKDEVKKIKYLKCNFIAFVWPCHNASVVDECGKKIHIDLFFYTFRWLLLTTLEWIIYHFWKNFDSLRKTCMPVFIASLEYERIKILLNHPLPTLCNLIVLGVIKKGELVFYSSNIDWDSATK